MSDFSFFSLGASLPEGLSPADINAHIYTHLADYLSLGFSRADITSLYSDFGYNVTKTQLNYIFRNAGSLTGRFASIESTPSFVPLEDSFASSWPGQLDTNYRYFVKMQFYDPMLDEYFDANVYEDTNELLSKDQIIERAAIHVAGDSDVYLINGELDRFFKA